jgi:hypothetical protein
MEHNPYAAPQAEIADPLPEGLEVGQLASGQKLVIYAILVNFAVIGLQLVLGPSAGLLGIVGTAMSIVGMIRLGRGMGFGRASRLLLVFAMLIPLVNLVTLLVLNSMATKHLRNAGYRVGLLGATK